MGKNLQGLRCLVSAGSQASGLFAPTLLGGKPPNFSNVAKEPQQAIAVSQARKCYSKFDTVLINLGIHVCDSMTRLNERKYQPGDHRQTLVTDHYTDLPAGDVHTPIFINWNGEQHASNWKKYQQEAIFSILFQLGFKLTLVPHICMWKRSHISTNHLVFMRVL